MVQAKRPMQLYGSGYSIVFSPEQANIVRLLTVGARRSFSQLVEAALGDYIPTAFGVDWPSAKRTTRPSKKPRQSRVFGVLFQPPQDEVLRYIMREKHVRYSEIIEQAFASYIPKTFDMDWPPAPRLSVTG